MLMYRRFSAFELWISFKLGTKLVILACMGLPYNSNDFTFSMSWISQLEDTNYKLVSFYFYVSYQLFFVLLPLKSLKKYVDMVRMIREIIVDLPSIMAV